MPAFEILATTSVVRTLDDLTDADYELIAEAVFSLADDPFPAGTTKLRMKNARLALVDGTTLAGPFLRIRARSASGGKSGGFRIIYVVDSAANRVYLAKISRRDDDTYKTLEGVLRRGKVVPFEPPPDP